MTHTPHMPLVAVPEPETTQIYDGETSWQKPWPRISPLLYKAPFFSFGPFLLAVCIALIVGIAARIFHSTAVPRSTLLKAVSGLHIRMLGQLIVILTVRRSLRGRAAFHWGAVKGLRFTRLSMIADGR